MPTHKTSNVIVAKTVATSLVPAQRELLLKEYDNLRAESLKRVEFRYQLYLGYTVVSAYILLTTGTVGTGAKPNESIRVSVLLLYPIISLFFAAAWSFNSLFVHWIGTYIREEVATQLPGLGWASYLKDKYRPIEWFELIATWVLFLLTPVLSLVFAGSTIFPSLSTYGDLLWLLVVSVLSYVLTFVILIRSYKIQKRIVEHKPLGGSANTFTSRVDSLGLIPNQAVEVVILGDVFRYKNLIEALKELNDLDIRQYAYRTSVDNPPVYVYLTAAPGGYMLRKGLDVLSRWYEGIEPQDKNKIHIWSKPVGGEDKEAETWKDVDALITQFRQLPTD